MMRPVILATMILMSLVGCKTIIERSAARCVEYGFTAKTPAMAQCVQNDYQNRMLGMQRILNNYTQQMQQNNSRSNAGTIMMKNRTTTCRSRYNNITMIYTTTCN